MVLYDHFGIKYFFLKDPKSSSKPHEEKEEYSHTVVCKGPVAGKSITVHELKARVAGMGRSLRNLKSIDPGE